MEDGRTKVRVLMDRNGHPVDRVRYVPNRKLLLEGFIDG